MTQTDRPLRADAARNRARVLEVAYETFAAEGLSVPIDEIARRAGVGAGTVYRHFPTKEDLFGAVVESRIRRIVDDGRALVAGANLPGRRCSSSCGRWCWSGERPTGGWPTRWPGSGIDVEGGDARRRRANSSDLLGDLLRAAQQAGTVRRDVSSAGRQGDPGRASRRCRAYRPDAAERLTEVVLDGLRAR